MIPRPPSTTGYQPYLPEVDSEEAVRLYIHHATCAAAYFELTGEVPFEDLKARISARFAPPSIEHRVLTPLTHILANIFEE